MSQLEDERIETETRLEKMSRDMETVYQSKVAEKLQKLEESKQNVEDFVHLCRTRIFSNDIFRF